MEGQVPIFITPRERVAELYPQALGSLFVASYDSQGYAQSTPYVASERAAYGTRLPRVLLVLQHVVIARTAYRTPFVLLFTAVT
jgi:hypothetical protein